MFHQMSGQQLRNCWFWPVAASQRIGHIYNTAGTHNAQLSIQVQALLVCKVRLASSPQEGWTRICGVLTDICLRQPLSRADIGLKLWEPELCEAESNLSMASVLNANDMSRVCL